MAQNDKYMAPKPERGNSETLGIFYRAFGIAHAPSNQRLWPEANATSMEGSAAQDGPKSVLPTAVSSDEPATTAEDRTARPNAASNHAQPRSHGEAERFPGKNNYS